MYQGLYVDFVYPGCIFKDKDGNIIESSWVDIEGLNGEQAWILISDSKTIIFYGDKQLSKLLPLKYVESFLTEYSPEYKNR